MIEEPSELDVESRLAEGASEPPARAYLGEGMFEGESLAQAAEGWAQWCEHRCMTGLTEFLREAAAVLPGLPQDRERMTDAWLVDTFERAGFVTGDSVPNLLRGFAVRVLQVFGDREGMREALDIGYSRHLEQRQARADGEAEYASWAPVPRVHAMPPGLEELADPIDPSDFYGVPDAIAQALRDCKHADPDECSLSSKTRRRLRMALTAAMTQPRLTVWFGSMPESNGRKNWTAILRRDDGSAPLDSLTRGFTLARSEYHDRVRYHADSVRYLLGELPTEPCVLDYDADLRSPGGETRLPPANAHDYVQGLLFDIRGEILRYGTAYKNGDEDGIRRTSASACERLDQLAAFACRHMGAARLYIQRDHLQKAMHAPFLCRVTPEPQADHARIIVVEGPDYG